jgi:hypothetical protein
LDFLTILGEHEGEGLVVDADAAVAGSRSALIADKGQKARHLPVTNPEPVWMPRLRFLGPDLINSILLLSKR